MIDKLLSRLDGVKQTKPDAWIAKCPAHDDRSPSLSIRDAGGQILIHCFGGCKALDVVHAVGLELSDLFSGERKNLPGKKYIKADDALRCLRIEVAIVCMAADSIIRGEPIQGEDMTRLVKARKAITKALEAL